MRRSWRSRWSEIRIQPYFAPELAEKIGAYAAARSLTVSALMTAAATTGIFRSDERTREWLRYQDREVAAPPTGGDDIVIALGSPAQPTRRSKRIGGVRITAGKQKPLRNPNLKIAGLCALRAGSVRISYCRSCDPTFLVWLRAGTKALANKEIHYALHDDREGEREVRGRCASDGGSSVGDGEV